MRFKGVALSWFREYSSFRHQYAVLVFTRISDNWMWIPTRINIRTLLSYSILSTELMHHPFYHIYYINIFFFMRIWMPWCIHLIVKLPKVPYLFKSNKLCLNSNKTSFIHFQQTNALAPHFPYDIVIDDIPSLPYFKKILAGMNTYNII